MRYGDRHGSIVTRRKSHGGPSRYGKKIRRPGCEPDRLCNTTLSRCQYTALRTLAHKGIAP